MPARRKRPAQRAPARAAAVLVALLMTAGCGGKTLEDSPASIAPVRPADSPPIAQIPAGVVRPLAGLPQSAIFDDKTSQLVMVVAGSTRAAPAKLVTAGSPHTSLRVIELPGPADELTGDDHGTAYLPAHGGYVVVDLTAGRALRVGVHDADDVDFTAITRLSDGTVVLGAADGTLYSLKPGATGGRRAKIHAHVDSLAAQTDTVAVLDREQTSVTTIGSDGTIGQSLRAGQGATTMVSDPVGRLLVTDTRGGQLLVFGVDPLIRRQAYPVPLSPYGVTGSRGLVWVSQTAANIVIGYDLSTGIPLEKVRYPTVRQPNTLAFDDAAGTLFVMSASGDGLQVIEHAATGRR